eukprot:2514274-Amphidinium_carterae.1
MEHRGGGSFFIAHGPLNQGPVDQVYPKVIRFEIPVPSKRMGLLPRLATEPMTSTRISRFFSGNCLSVEG